MKRRRQQPPIPSSPPVPPHERLVDSTTVHFKFDKARLRRAAKDALIDLAGRVNREPRPRRIRLAIHGHTDAIGTRKYNIGLSARRALNVSRLLQRRLELRHVPPLVPYGERLPVARNRRDGRDDPEGRAQNRRVWVGVLVTPADP